MANNVGWGGGGGGRGHTLIVMVGEYYGDTREEKIKTTFPRPSSPWSNPLLALHAALASITSPVMLPAERSWRKGRLTFSLWKECRKFPLSSPSSLGVPGGLLMPLKLFGEFWRWNMQCFGGFFLYMILLKLRLPLFAWLQYLPCSFHPYHQSLRKKQYEIWIFIFFDDKKRYAPHRDWVIYNML